MSADLDEYILGHIEPEPDHLAHLNRHTALHHLYSHQCSGHLQGRLLSMLSHMIRPRRIIELGTFTGYSALCLAEGLAEGGELHTIEHNDEDRQSLLNLFNKHDGRIHLHIGDACQMIEELDGGWDLAFIDANKREYVQYLDLLLPKMAPGAFILADNTLWAGKVADPTETDAQTLGIRHFNDYAASLAGKLHPVILPLRDGMTLMRLQ